MTIVHFWTYGCINWRRWRQQFWPTVYLVDKRGRLRYRWEGELNYAGAGGEARLTEPVGSLLQELQ